MDLKNSEIIEYLYRLHCILPSPSEVAMALKWYESNENATHLDAVIEVCLRTGITPSRAAFHTRYRKEPLMRQSRSRAKPRGILATAIDSRAEERTPPTM